jgi:4-carboxymuconolactone decarboxylase
MARPEGNLVGDDRGMSRLPKVPRSDLDDAGQALWDSITSTRGAAVVEGGGLVGPFNAWVTASDVGTRLADLGAALRFRTSIDRRLLELAIITTGAHWKAEFEWWAHSRMAREHGVTDDVIDAVARGEEPPFSADDDAGRAVHTVARQLAATGRIDAAAYDAAQRLLGDRGMVELVALCGYYALVSFTLNAFEVPLPAGATPVWS